MIQTKSRYEKNFEVRVKVPNRKLNIDSQGFIRKDKMSIV